MNGLDWTIIGIYIAALVAMSVWLGKGQENDEDYYVGGRDLPWWAVGISTMATQSSVVSFISIPAFVAIKEGGGLTWLQYELAVPLAMIFVMVFLVPFFRKLELISVYEYLERRFSLSVRLFISGVFLLARGIGTGAGVYATALILQVVTGLSFTVVVLFVGVITVIYDTIGGMKAVVWSDVVQMVVLVIGVLICIGYSVNIAGGVGAAIDSLSPERWRALDPALGLDGESGAPLWAYLIGGFFLYASYYGTDQSQTQRELSAPTLADTKRSLVLNGLGRFPLTLLYLAFGVAIGAAFVHLPELQLAVAKSGKPDTLVPRFVVDVLPQGVRAVIVAAMLAAAMSSLDSALNSLSAATMQDFVLRFRKLDTKTSLRASKITTVIWGVVITGFAFVVAGGEVARTVIEAINKIGSAFYGPILGAFMLGVLSKRAGSLDVIVGVIVGVAVNVGLWLGAPQVHWMWWNLIGFAVTCGLALGMSNFTPKPTADQIEHFTLSGSGIWEAERKWLGTYAILIGYFVLIVGVGLALNSVAG